MADSVTAQTLITSVMTLAGALAGVIVTNVSNTRRLRLQLRHDSKEKAKERLVAMRRDLYLKAAEAVVNANSHFGSLPQSDLTRPDFTAPFRDVMAMGAKLQLVVNQGTAELVSDLLSFYGELQLKLAAKVIPIHLIRSQIDTQNLQYDNAQVEIKRLLAAMTQYNESGQRDRELFERLNRSPTFARETADRVANERAGFWGQLTALQREYARDLLPEVRRIAELQTRVIVELRDELDVGGDIEVFRGIMMRQMQRVEQAIDEFDRAVFGPDPAHASTPGTGPGDASHVASS